MKKKLIGRHILKRLKRFFSSSKYTKCIVGLRYILHIGMTKYCCGMRRMSALSKSGKERPIKRYLPAPRVSNEEEEKYYLSRRMMI